VTGARSARPALHAADRVDGLWRTASRLVARRAARPGRGRGVHGRARGRAAPEEWTAPPREHV